MNGSHGLATGFALCEAYGLSGNRNIRPRPPKAGSTSSSAHKPHTTFGWHYVPNDNVSSDTSVVGWLEWG